MKPATIDPSASPSFHLTSPTIHSTVPTDSTRKATHKEKQPALPGRFCDSKLAAKQELVFRTTPEGQTSEKSLPTPNQLTKDQLEGISEIIRSLAKLPFADVQSLEVTYDHNAILISGRLDSYYHKQLVLSQLQFAYQSNEVIDQITVAPPFT